MVFAMKNVFDLYVFDENDRLVVKMDAINSSEFIQLNDRMILSVKSPLFYSELIKFANNNSNLSDYENCLNSEENNTIVFNFKNNKKCKIVAKSYLTDYINGKECKYSYEMPNAYLISEWMVEHNFGASEYIIKIIILPYNENGDMFKMHIRK